MKELTSPNTAPDLITLSKTFSIGFFISGEYCFNNPSSSWSDERRDSAYANSTMSRLRWGVSKGRTVAFAENCNSRENLPCPTSTTSVLLYQYERTGWGSRLTGYGELVSFGGPVIIEKLFKVDHFANVFLLRQR